jgi:hypothetical protein
VNGLTSEYRAHNHGAMVLSKKKGGLVDTESKAVHMIFTLELSSEVQNTKYDTCKPKEVRFKTLFLCN